jgi:hypothetical protein
MNLRNVGAGGEVCSVVIRSGAGVVFGVRNAQVPSDVSPDPVGDVFVVHRVLISLVAAWARHVLIL